MNLQKMTSVSTSPAGRVGRSVKLAHSVPSRGQNTQRATISVPTAMTSTAPAAISLAAPALHQWVVSGLSTARSIAELTSSSASTAATQSAISAVSTGSSSAQNAATKA